MNKNDLISQKSEKNSRLWILLYSELKPEYTSFQPEKISAYLRFLTHPNRLNFEFGFKLYHYGEQTRTSNTIDGLKPNPCILTQLSLSPKDCFNSVNVFMNKTQHDLQQESPQQSPETS